MAVRALKNREVARIVFRGRPSRRAKSSDSCPGTCAKKSIRTCARSSMRSTSCSTMDWSTSISIAARSKSRRWRYMRGRTLSDAFVILDEAQNATGDQLKMFLTRLGSASQDGRYRRRHANRSCPRSNAADCATRRRGLRGIDDVGGGRTRRNRRRSASAGRTDHPRVCARTPAVIHYRNDVRRSGVDGRALVATTRKLLAAIGEAIVAVADHRRRRRRSAGSIATTAARIRPTDVLSFPMLAGRLRNPETARGRPRDRPPQSACWGTS